MPVCEVTRLIYIGADYIDTGEYFVKTKTKLSRIGLGIILGLSSGTAASNPQGANIVNGHVTFAQPNANTLNITNSHGAIINWQKIFIAHVQGRGNQSCRIND